MKKIDWLIILLLIIISVVTLKDLYKPGFYTSHDGPHQVVRLYYFDQLVRDGQIPPRYVTGLLNGYGYPLFVFSYHMPWIIAEPVHLAGLSIIDSIKATFLIGFILSGITMYIFQKKLFGRLAALTGTFLYLFAPYRFSNIFVRAAIGDATSFIFPPLLFLALYQLKKTENKRWIWIVIGAFAYASLLLSHAMVFLFFSLSFGIYILFSLLTEKRKIKFLVNAILIILIAIGLSSYYFLPSIVERNYVIFSQVMTNFGGGNFLTIKDLLYSAWGYGMMHAKEGGMSFQLGIAQWIIVLLSGLTFVTTLVKKPKAQIRSSYLEEAYYLILFLLSLLIMLPVSLPFWKYLNNIAVIDFPWRTLPVTVFAVSVLAGFVINKIKYSGLIAFIIILIAFYGNRNHLRINQSLDWSVPFFLKLEKTTNMNDEYTPKWVNNEVVNKLPKAKIEPFDAGSKVDLIKSTSNYLEFMLKNEKDDTLRVNTIYYPGWKVYIDGKPSKINYQNNGLIEFPVDKGNHLVKLKFEETPLRLISDLITIITGATVIFLFVRYRKSK